MTEWKPGHESRRSKYSQVVAVIHSPPGRNGVALLTLLCRSPLQQREESFHSIIRWQERSKDNERDSPFGTRTLACFVHTFPLLCHAGTDPGARGDDAGAQPGADESSPHNCRPWAEPHPSGNRCHSDWPPWPGSSSWHPAGRPSAAAFPGACGTAPGSWGQKVIAVNSAKL